MPPTELEGRPYVLDVSRLVWRCWRGGVPTGIDRVCLAYLERFGPRSRALIQKGKRRFLLDDSASDRLFAVLLQGAGDVRRRLAALAPGWLRGRRARPTPGAIYLNVGHTGLDEPSLPAWIAEHRLRAVYLVHDLIPVTHPEFCRAGEAARHCRRLDNMLASASGLIANSKDTLSAIADYAADRGRSLPPATAAWIQGAELTASPAPRTLDRPHFVVVGTIEGRKNHFLLLQVWKRLVAATGPEAPHLVIIGSRGWESGAAEAMLDRIPALDPYVHELGSCSDEELAGWIAGARALLMPSFAEGFGLPLVEALEIGTPAIVSDLAVFREIAGDIPVYLDPLDAPAWERAIRSFLGDSPERQRQIAAARAFRAPRWDDHFSQVEDWLESLPSRFD